MLYFEECFKRFSNKFLEIDTEKFIKNKCLGGEYLGSKLQPLTLAFNIHHQTGSTADYSVKHLKDTKISVSLPPVKTICLQ